MKALLALCLVLAAGGASAFAAEGAEEVGAISGRLIDSRDQKTLVGHAVVFVCDGATGRPLIKDTFQPLGTKGVSIQSMASLAHAVTDASGAFELKNVPAGKYRLVAQSWSGFAGVPDREDPSESVFLHGVKNDIEVTAGGSVDVFIRPLGAATMTLINDPEEEHAFLVLSTAPMRGDPVLPFFFWGENFATHAIGVTLMETHKVTFHGLPDGELHAGLFNYDNNPGIGGASFKVVDDGSTRIPIYATWSNGKYEPPPSLLPLVEHLERKQISATDLLKARFPDEFAATIENRNPEFEVLTKHGDEKLDIEGYGEVRILDLAAASTYRDLREHHKKRREASGKGSK